jgi:hypothetical protein
MFNTVRFTTLTLVPRTHLSVPVYTYSHTELSQFDPAGTYVARHVSYLQRPFAV